MAHNNECPYVRREILREDWPFYLGWATLGADDAINCIAANGGFRGQVSVQEAMQENHCGGVSSYVERGAATC